MMRKTAYLDKKMITLVLLVGLITMIPGGNNTYTISAEIPKVNHPQPISPQDNQSNKNEQALSGDAVKMFLNQIEIYGQIAKPQTVFIIPGTDPRVDGLRIVRHFFPTIFRTVEKSALKRVNKKREKNEDHIIW